MEGTFGLIAMSVFLTTIVMNFPTILTAEYETRCGGLDWLWGGGRDVTDLHYSATE